MNCLKLPGVKKIYMLSPEDLPEATMIAAISGIIPEINFSVVEEIPFFNIPSCVKESTPAKGNNIETSTLEFKSLIDINTDIFHAFIVETVNSETFLIGDSDFTFPQITKTDSVGTPGNQSAGYDYKVVHKSLKSLYPCRFIGLS